MSEIGATFGLIPVGIGLLVFGVIYNLVVGWMERNGYDEGYTAIMVVVGVLVTLGRVGRRRGSGDAAGRGCGRDRGGWASGWASVCMVQPGDAQLARIRWDGL